MTDDDLALSVSFGHDLLTDWIPDALGATDVLRGLAAGRAPGSGALAVEWLRVPLAHRREVVPVVSTAVRARLHHATERALRGVTAPPEVFSYRGPGWDYTTAFRRRGERLRDLAGRDDLPLVLGLDVHRFGRSLPLATVLGASWMSEQLGALVSQLHAAAGHVVFSSHRWANRVGGAALAPVDATLGGLVPGRWLRWADDWHVFVRDEAEADRVREAVREALAALGLTLASAKGGLRPAATVLAGPARDVAGAPSRVWRASTREDDLRGMRFALPRLPPDPRASREVPAAVRKWPALLPRAVMYLNRAVDTTDGRAAVAELLDGVGRDRYAAARLLALASRYAEVADLVPDAVLELAADDLSPVGLRELATRVAVLARRPHLAPDPTPRLRPWLSAGGHAGDSPPSVDTLL
ncbi:hypothetical protein [Streptomyces sp. NPDC057702]|uniref:hypothetical protein n=1 Tax=unclassified Streptomyces TaxID=2593676 RepID=UPI0036C1B276